MTNYEIKQQGIQIGYNGKNGDAIVLVYNVDGALVALTNGDPVWQDSDPCGFEDLLNDEGINIGPCGRRC